MPFDIEPLNHAQLSREAADELVGRGAVCDSELVIITKGDLMGKRGGTNAMKIVEVGNLAERPL